MAALLSLVVAAYQITSTSRSFKIRTPGAGTGLCTHHGHLFRVSGTYHTVVTGGGCTVVTGGGCNDDTGGGALLSRVVAALFWLRCCHWWWLHCRRCCHWWWLRCCRAAVAAAPVVATLPPPHLALFAAIIIIIIIIIIITLSPPHLTLFADIIIVNEFPISTPTRTVRRYHHRQRIPYLHPNSHCSPTITVHLALFADPLRIWGYIWGFSIGKEICNVTAVVGRTGAAHD